MAVNPELEKALPHLVLIFALAAIGLAACVDWNEISSELGETFSPSPK